MQNQPLRRIVIVGGGTAGWMAAAPLSQLLCNRGDNWQVDVVESPEIGTVGVGEATLPPIRAYNETLGIDVVDFLLCTKATFKLGIEFKDWGRIGHRFFHGFGDFGPPVAGRPAWMHWLRLRQDPGLASYEAWSTATVMARRHRFRPPRGDTPSPSNAYSFAFHFDAGLYAAYLRDYALRHGARRIEGTIVDVLQRSEDGFVDALLLRDGRRVEGDLFIDCSGFRALLIGGAMKSPYEDWSHWLPCDRALAVPSARTEPLAPFTTSTARAAGWQWRIPLQHRTGNGHVYCSAHTSDAEAERVLLEGLDGPPLDTPRQLRFTTGRRREAWVKNVVAVGLSSGFLEPLESTSIQLIMDAVGRIIEKLPDRRFHPSLAAEFNRQMARQYESIRDFIILHYKLSARDDSDFWRDCAAMPVPDSLAHQIEVFRATGRMPILDSDSFAEPSWVSILLGNGVVPEALDPVVLLPDEAALRTHFERVRAAIDSSVDALPGHGDYVADVLRAAARAAAAAR